MSKLPAYEWGCHTSERYSCKYDTTATSRTIHFCTIFMSKSNPTSSKEGAKTVFFYHTKQKKNRKFVVNTFHFDITQDPPVPVSRSEYYKLQWVKDLIAAGK